MKRVPAFSLIVDRSRWKAIAQALRRDVNDFIVPVEPNPARTEIITEPFESVTDVHDRLGALEAHLLQDDDRRAVFLTVYSEMTGVTLREIQDGGFEDGEWMQQYLVRFAEYYRQAFLRYERGEFEEVPAPWIVAFGTAMREDALILQDAMLGINAHINYDLALTLSDIGLDPNRRQKHRDHTRINRILHQLVAVQQELLAERYAPGLRRVGAAMGDLDTIGLSFGFTAAREKAWRVGVVRTDARWVPVDRATKWVLSRTAAGGAFSLLKPSKHPELFRVLRDIESDQLSLTRYANEYHSRAKTVSTPQ